MYKTKTVTAADQWTDPIALSNFFNYTGQGTPGITVALYRSFDEGQTWEKFDSNITPFSLVGFSPTSGQRDKFESLYYKLGVEEEETFEEGSVDLRLGI